MQVWLPDMTLYNLVAPTTLMVQGLSVVVFSNGMVIWMPPLKAHVRNFIIFIYNVLPNKIISFQTHCDVNYANWPWGEQNCTFTAGSWTYDMEQVDIQPYLGFTEAQAQDSPLNFEHLLSKNKASSKQ